MHIYGGRHGLSEQNALYTIWSVQTRWTIPETVAGAEDLRARWGFAGGYARGSCPSFLTLKEGSGGKPPPALP